MSQMYTIMNMPREGKEKEINPSENKVGLSGLNKWEMFSKPRTRWKMTHSKLFSFPQLNSDFEMLLPYVHT